MPILTLEEVLRAARAGESADWEFKSAQGGLPGSFWETYSAMANTEGGVIVLGASEKPDGIHLDGLPSDRFENYRRDIWSTLNNRSKVSRNLLSESDIFFIDLGGSRLVVARIPRASRSERPIFLNSNPMGHTFRRQHEGDFRCPDDVVRRMLADADPTPVDQRMVPGFKASDLDAASLNQYRQRLRTAQVEHPWLSFEDTVLLERLGGWTRDRATGREGPTLAGVLMFGKGHVIREAEAAPDYFVDYREILDPTTRWSDRIYPDGTWESNLFQFYQRVWPKLAAGLPLPFQLEGEMRVDNTPTHEALREAFVNALIHADYSGKGGVVVERHSDQYVFRNPGTLLISQEQFRQGGLSECRNKNLQQMFLMIGGGERAGSGVDKIRSGWRSRHWRAPKLIVTEQPDRIILELSMVSLIPAQTLAFLRERFGADWERLRPPEQQALATAHLEDSVSNARLQELLEVHRADITRMLQGLCERGFLASQNWGRWTTYHIPAPATSETAEMSLFGGDSHHSEASSHHLDGGSHHLGGGEEGGGPIISEEWESLKQIALPVASKGKASTPVVEAALLQLCAGRFLTAEQLGALLNRGAANLRQRYLQPLLEQGRMRLKYPHQPTRPDQAYTAVENQ